MSEIIKGYNKKVAPKPRDQTLKSDCRKKQNVQWRKTVKLMR